MLDLASGDVRPAGGFEHAKNIDPQWSADGKALYFVSDRGGISNIYRTEIGGATTQLTNFLTGASGITELSPALSVASNRLVFSAFEDNGYTIYALETPSSSQAVLLQTCRRMRRCCRRAARAPARCYAAAERHARSATGDCRGDPRRGYKPKLGIDYAGQPVIGVGKDPFGPTPSAACRSCSATCSATTRSIPAQVTNRFDEFGATAVYINRTHAGTGASRSIRRHVWRSYTAGVGPAARRSTSRTSTGRSRSIAPSRV